MKWLLMGLIRLYQLCLSPFLGGCCRFYPSCSDYALEALKVHGAWKGAWLTIKRLGKCQPWHRGGYDPVSQESSESAPVEERSNADH